MLQQMVVMVRQILDQAAAAVAMVPALAGVPAAVEL
jgi:hypothetical protein